MSRPDEESSDEIAASTEYGEPRPKIEKQISSNHANAIMEPEKNPSDHSSRVLEAVTVEQHCEDLPKPKKPWSFYFAFTGMAITVLCFHLDATGLGVSLPTIASELHGTSLETFWANICYNLCVVITQPLWASVSQAFGRKPPFYGSMVLFAVGSLIFALAQHLGILILGRVLQGLGGGGLDVLAEIILSDITTLQERSFYLGLMAIPITVGSILGPSLSALLTTFVSWRWLGWLNLPLLGFASPLIVFFLRLRRIELDESLITNMKRLDWTGMTLYVIGITAFVLPLSWAGSLYPWGSWQTLLPMLIGVALLVTFGIYEDHPTAPIVPHRLFRSKTANMTMVGGFIHGMILFSILQYLPLFYQAVELETTIGSAVSLLPTSVSSVLVAAGSMMLITITKGGYRWVLRSAWITLTLGTGMLVLLDLSSPSSKRYGLPVLWGVGVALLRLLLLPIQASVQDVDDTGVAIAQLLTLRLFGGVVALAVASTVFSTVFSSSMSSMGQLQGPLNLLNNGSQAIAFIPELRKMDIDSGTLDAVLTVYLKSFRTIFYIMIGFGGLGFITALFTDDLDINKTDVGRQGFEG